MKNNLLFILNKNSGKVKKNLKLIYKAVDNFIDKEKFNVELAETYRVEQIKNLIAKYKTLYNPIVVAVGGDGTVNKTINEIVNKNIILGIIPLGSGNALARELKIPLNINDAVNVINNLNVKEIDLMRLNEMFYGACVGGVGFDALIAQKFESLVNRGLKNYIRLSIKEFFKYKNIDILLKIEDKEFKHNAFLVSFANTSQYGNNAFIAPKARPDDGIIDIVVLKKLEIYNAPGFAMKLFTKKVDTYRYLEYYRAKKFSIEGFSRKMYVHIDGEPINIENSTIKVELVTKALKVIFLNH